MDNTPIQAWSNDLPQPAADSVPSTDGKPRVIPVFTTEIVVLPSDTDEFHHANNTRYVHWMQELATAHSAALGWDAPRYLSLGVMWVARRHIIEYISPAFVNDRLLVETWVYDLKKITSTRKYRFTRMRDGQRIAEAETRWAMVSAETGRPARIPDGIGKIFIPLGTDPEPPSFA